MTGTLTLIFQRVYLRPGRDSTKTPIHARQPFLVAIVALFTLSGLIGIIDPLFTTTAAGSRASLNLHYINADEDIVTGEYTDTLTAGQRRYYNLRISNIGSEDVDSSLSFDAHPPGWTLMFENSETTMAERIDADGYIELYVIVTAPANISQSHDQLIRVIATVDGTGEQFYGDLTIEVLPPSFTIHDPDLSANVGFEENVAFDLNITNLFDTADEIEAEVNGAISYANSSKQDHWTYSLDPASLTLGGYETEMMVLTVRTPLSREYASSHIGVVFDLRIISAATGYEQTHVVSVKISQQVQLNITLDPPQCTAQPAGTANFTVHLRNDGTHTATVSPTVRSGPQGWNLNFDPLSVTAVPDGDTTFRAQVRLPRDAVAGQHIIGCELTAQSSSFTFDLAVNVEQAYGIGLNLTENGYLIRRGAENVVPLLVDNNGNGRDLLRLRFLHIPSSWSLGVRAVTVGDAPDGAVQERDLTHPFPLEEGNRYLDPNSPQISELNLSAPPHARLRVEFVIEAEAPGAARIYNITVYGTTTDEPSHTVRIPLRFQASALELSNIHWSPSTPRHGDTMTFKVTVSNRLKSDSGPFDIVLSIDNEPVDTVRVATIAGNYSTEAKLNYEAKEGEHLMTVALAGEIISEAQPVKESHPLTVKAAQEEGLPGFGPVSLLIGIALLVLLLKALGGARPSR